MIDVSEEGKSAELELCNTGVDDLRRALPPGQADPHWMVSGPGIVDWRPAMTCGPCQVTGGDLVSSRIWLDRTGESGISGKPYTFRLVFSLVDLDPETAQISGDWASSGDVHLSLNGQTQKVEDRHFHLCGEGLFVPGPNTLEFGCKRDPASGPSYLDVRGLAGRSPVKFVGGGTAWGPNRRFMEIPAGPFGHFVDLAFKFDKPFDREDHPYVSAQVILIGKDGLYHWGSGAVCRAGRGNRAMMTTTVLGFESEFEVVVRVWRHHKPGASTPSGHPGDNDDPNWPAGTGVVVVVNPGSGSGMDC